MAEIEGKKISGVPERTELTGNELYPFADSGSQGHVKGSVLKGYCATPIGEAEGTAFDGARGKAVEDKMNKLPRYIRGNIIDNLDGNDSVRYDTNRVRLFFTTWDTSTGKLNNAGFTKYIDAATSENAGVMSAADKQKLDSLSTESDVYVIDWLEKDGMGEFSGNPTSEQYEALVNAVSSYKVIIIYDKGDTYYARYYNDDVDYRVSLYLIKVNTVYGADTLSMMQLVSYDINVYSNLRVTSFCSIRNFEYKGYGTKFLSDDGTYKQIDIPDTSSLATKDELSTKQDVLVSGTNIKTVSGQSILGEGDITIEVPEGGITDAPSDGSTYGRNNGAWIKVEMPDVSGFITETEADEKYATPALVDSKVAALVNSAPATLDTLKELADALGNDANFSTTITTKLGEKVDKTTYESDKAGFATKTELANKLDTSTYNSDKAGFATKDSLTTKQDALVSGINIKTINNQSLLGEGNIAIAAEDSKVYVFELSKYITDFSGAQRFTGTISSEDRSILINSLTENKLVLGYIDAIAVGCIPLTVSRSGDTFHLIGNLIGSPIVMKIDGVTSEYVGYYKAEVVETSDSSTVNIDPLEDEFIIIYSGSSYDLNQITIDSTVRHYTLSVGTNDQAVTLNCYGLVGVIGATFTGSKIILEANSEYEIDVKDDVAVVAKINKP